MPRYAYDLLKALEIGGKTPVLPFGGLWYACSTEAVKKILHEDAPLFERDTQLTRWAEVESYFPQQPLNLLKHFGRQGRVKEPAPEYPDWSKRPEKELLKEENLAGMLLASLLQPYTEAIPEQVITAFHQASVYLEDRRSGRVEASLHLDHWHQSAREALSQALGEVMQENAPIPDEKLFSAVLHSAYRSVLNLLGWSAYWLSEDLAYVDNLYEAEDAVQLERKVHLFLYEVLRVHPSAWVLSRRLKGEWSLGDRHFSNGEELFIPILCFHRSPRYFEQPEAFLPSRFESRMKDPWSYLPFGRGVHACPGSTAGLGIAASFVRFLVREKLRPEKSLINPGQEDTTMPISLNPFIPYQFNLVKQSTLVS